MDRWLWTCGQCIFFFDTVELEGEQDGFELLNEVKDNPQMLVQPPEPRKSKPRKHKRKHRKDKERKRGIYLHSLL